MRPLPTLVLVQSLALIVLALLWSQRTDAAPQPSQHAAARLAGADATGLAVANAERQLHAELPAAVDREAAPPSTVATGRVVLQGRLLGVTSSPTEEQVRLWATFGPGFRQGHLGADGSYAIAGLAPGPIRLHCDVDGCARLDLEHRLDARPIQRLDLQLLPATKLRVFLQTPEGQALPQGDMGSSLKVVATREPLSGDLDPVENISVGDLGIGRFSRVSAPGAPGEYGLLELDEPPPANAALVLRHLVLAQLPIAVDQGELHFRIAPQDVTARLATVQLRVLGPDGQPAAKASVSLMTAQGSGSHHKPTDEHGAVTIERVLPGLCSFEIWSENGEAVQTHLTIPAGAVLDLGDVVLTDKRNLTGKIVDERGAAAPGRVLWTPIEQWLPPHPLVDRRFQRADGDGMFTLWNCGRRRYVLQATADDGQLGFVIFDGATLGAEPFVVTVHPTRTLRLDARGANGLRCVVLADANGVPLIVQRIEPAWPEQFVQVPSGDYRCDVYDGRGERLSSTPLTIGANDEEKVIR